MRILPPLACFIILAAPVRADDPIDSPMYRDPLIGLPPVVPVYPPGLVPLWLQALDRPETDLKCQAALTIASSEVAERSYNRELAGNLKSPHDALQFSVKGSMLSIVSPRDPVLSEALTKDAGMQWQPQASVWRTQVTDSNVSKLNEVFTKLGTYLNGQALPATPTERGLTSNEIAALEKTPQPNGTPLDEKSMRHVENAMQLVSRTFTPTELADLRVRGPASSATSVRCRTRRSLKKPATMSGKNLFSPRRRSQFCSRCCGRKFRLPAACACATS